jgi:DHA1 family bicyclomycin/chloramphenicol resistance-like MFS transporter
MILHPSDTSPRDERLEFSTNGVIILIAIGSVPHIAINLIVPALPAIAREYNTSLDEIRLAVTCFLVGFAAFLPICGPLADALGRRKVLLIGLGVFGLCGLLGAFAPSARTFIALRVAQGMSAACATVVARALLRDRFDGPVLVKATAYMNTGMASVPALGPLLGAVLFELNGWRLVALTICMVGVATFVLSAKHVQKDGTNQPNGSLWSVLESWAAVLRSREFVLISVVNALQHGTWWVFLAGSPDLFLQEFSLSPSQFGLIPPLVTGSYMVGSVVVARLVMKVPAVKLLGWAFVCQFVSICALVGFPALGEASVAKFVIPEVVNSACVGGITAIAMAQSLQIFPERAGAAAGLSGCMTMLVAAACTGVVSLVGGPAPSLSIPVLMMAAAAISLAAFLAYLALAMRSTRRSARPSFIAAKSRRRS